MKHIVLLFLIAVLTVGFGVVLFSGLLHFRFREKRISSVFYYLLNGFIYIALTTFNTYFVTMVPDAAVLSDFIAVIVFFIWFGFFISCMASFYLEIAGISQPWSRLIMNIPSIATAVMLLMPFLISGNFNERYHILKFESDSICYISFFLIYVLSTVFLWLRKKVNTSINELSPGFFALLNTIFLPLFIIDGFYPILSVQMKIIPFGFKFSIFYFLITSIYCYYYLKRRFFQQTKIVCRPELTENFVIRFGISKREKEVLQLLYTGLTYQEIAEKLSLSFKTVDNHLQKIYQKTVVHNRDELLRMIQRGDSNRELKVGEDLE